eukprot:scaffold44750_cov54-Phaeocystis_antarctica.AAC.4
MMLAVADWTSLHAGRKSSFMMAFSASPCKPRSLASVARSVAPVARGGEVLGVRRAGVRMAAVRCSMVASACCATRD